MFATYPTANLINVCVSELADIKATWQRSLPGAVSMHAHNKSFHTSSDFSVSFNAKGSHIIS